MEFTMIQESTTSTGGASPFISIADNITSSSSRKCCVILETCRCFVSNKLFGHWEKWPTTSGWKTMLLVSGTLKCTETSTLYFLWAGRRLFCHLEPVPAPDSFHLSFSLTYPGQEQDCENRTLCFVCVCAYNVEYTRCQGIFVCAGWVMYV